MAKTVAKKKAPGTLSLLDWLSAGSITLNAVVYDQANPVSASGDDDLITGTAGDDLIDGLAGAYDTVNYENAKKVTVDLGAGTASGEGKDTLVNVENVIGSAWGSDSIKGDLNNNLLDGWGGNDKLWGGEGDDILFGGDGNDKLWGDDGADTLYGDAGNDHLFGGEGDDVLYGGDRNDQLNGDAGNDTLYGGDGNDKLVGGAGDDVLYGDKGNDQLRGGDGNDTLYAGAGNDVMFGGAGDDTYYVESAKDKVNEKAGEGNDTVVASYSFSLLKMKAVENLTLSEDATPLHIDATGNALDNVLIGNSGNNALNGKTGSDTLFGGEGNDIFVFDNLYGVDTIQDFTAGSDLLQLSSKVFASLAGQVQEGNLVQGDMALDADDFLIFDAATGVLSYDADGNGAGEAVQIAILGVGELLASDFTIG